MNLLECDKTIFVFGSNEAGHHGAGAARTALKEHGAIYGRAFGLQGDSFAIPTKDKNIETLPVEKIIRYVDIFKTFAQRNNNLAFYVTKIGCGLAGYEDEQIAPLFKDSPSNCLFSIDWRPYLTASQWYVWKPLDNNT